MVGLSIVLEARSCSGSFVKTPKVINKATFMVISKPPPLPPPPSPYSPTTFRLPTFLEHCFLCRKNLLPGKDIYMYKGDRAFCSVDCRCKQIFMDEEEIPIKDNCSLAAIKPNSASSRTSSSASTASGHRKNSTRNRAGGFVY